mmetsp:Transcript_47809/g.132851  ORF Transcript_47809/g.132851 Transcript_47809/m.132851 type:complete len:111 (-) Transcript_47809:159-491(-)|eukprot:CAMPEP_0179106032 /NCGR_PEP_ID=MMETSP0796-20121207/49274_1 /TAXON_ID=73915 /ORGANISM="Pyrodinium bahamense, Strain pbaha01" /LENGTH=110 /DNA_ID=CAMNT_0020804037 /DNA_START=82 /DNA_END=414 /DNA_ORIENTATION=+
MAGVRTAVLAALLAGASAFPIFHGKLIARPWEARPPELLTRPCQGEMEGRPCKLIFMSGACEKAHVGDVLVCKPWPFGGNDNDKAIERRSAVVAEQQSGIMSEQQSGIVV